MRASTVCSLSDSSHRRAAVCTDVRPAKAKEEEEKKRLDAFGDWLENQSSDEDDGDAPAP
jgi:hypothetical protein